MQHTYSNKKDSSFFSFSHEVINENQTYKMIWQRRGCSKLNVDGIDYTLKENQILFLTPLNRLSVIDSQDILNQLSFNREFYCIQQHDQEVSCHGYLFFGSSDVPIVSLDKKEQESFALLIDAILEELENADLIQGEMLQVLLKRFLIKCTRLARKTLTNPEINQDKLDIIRQFNVLVEMHFKQKHKVADYADLLNKSPKTISNLFGEYNDKTPLQVIQDRIGLEAKRLFIYTDKTAKEVGYELGFNDAAQFSRFFSKVVGKSPTDFKKSKIL
ncbi:helix-turn-helix domain-containing protein [Marinifilum sp.]|uniref:helix-turn-helix domain-containing protein n=1 Tax=Marinifilum sp. TaxID=2033137 RepID=UPI003BAC2519